MASDEKLSVSQLAKLCQDGDKQAWKDLISRLSPLIFSICRRMNLTREESFDIYGQVCYLLLSNLNRVQSVDKILSFVATTTRREIFQHNRKTGLLRKFEDTIVKEIYNRPVRTPDDILEKEERSETVIKAMIELPRKDFDLLYLLFFDKSDLSYDQIAERIGIPVSSIGPNRGRALTRLSKILKKKGLSL